MKILFIGPRTNIKDPSKTGGVIVLFEDLLHQCKKRDIDFVVIDTNKANYPNIFLALLSIYIRTFLLSFRVSHVSLHGTAKDYMFIAPLVVFLTKVLNKQSSLRKFAGNFAEIYESSSRTKKKLIEFALKNSDYNFFETKYLVGYFSALNQNTCWFPNVREKRGARNQSKFGKKFVFISQLYKTKGVNEILEASSFLPDGYTIDIYGPLKDDYADDSFRDFRANYQGSLKADDVLKTLNKYDVLILPTYYPGEGYPGIVIEALSLGKPVIVTDLPSIQEMVDERCAIFVKPKSVEDIVNAIMKFNSDNYASYSMNALKAFEQFDSDVQTEIFFQNMGLKC